MVVMWQSCQPGSGCGSGTGAVRPEQVRDRACIGQRIGARKRASLARTGARLSGASRSGAKQNSNATVEYPGGVNRDHIYEPTKIQKLSRTISHQGSHNFERKTHASRPRNNPPSPAREVRTEQLNYPPTQHENDPADSTQRKRNQRRPTQRDRTPSRPSCAWSGGSDGAESDQPNHGHSTPTTTKRAAATVGTINTRRF